MKRLSFGAYLKLCALNSQALDGKPTTDPLKLKRQIRSAALSSKRRPSILLLLLLLVSCANMNRAQTPAQSPLARAASAEKTSPTGPVKEAQPHLATVSNSGHATGGGFSLKRAALGILRFGKSLITALGFGEGKNPSTRSDSPGLVQASATVNPLPQMPLIDNSPLLAPIMGRTKPGDTQTVYLEVERRDTEKLWLRMHNKSGWPVAVRTFTTYFNRTRAIDLGDGRSVFTLPGDREIESLHYYVEKDPTASSEVKAPEVFHGDSYAISWVPTNGSILFAVPLRQIEPGLKIYVPFNYSSELNKQLIFNNKPEHRVYLRGADLNRETDNHDSLPAGFLDRPNVEITKDVMASDLPFHERLTQRLNLLIKYQRAQNWQKQYDLLSEVVTQGDTKEEHTRRLKHWYSEGLGDILVDFVPKSITVHNPSLDHGEWTLSGCAALRENGRIVKLYAAASAYREKDDWYFSPIGVITPIDGKAEACDKVFGHAVDSTRAETTTADLSETKSVAALSADATPVDWVRVKFEVDGKERPQSYKIFIYVNNQMLVPTLVDGGFIVPPELKTPEFDKHIELHFMSGEYELVLKDLNKDNFDSEWLLGVMNPPFKEQPDLPLVKDGKKLQLIYYVEFHPRNAEGTGWVKRVYK